MKDIIALIVFALTVLISCSKRNFIEPDPLSSATIDALYKTDKNYQDAVIGTYQALRNQYANGWQFGDLRGYV